LTHLPPPLDEVRAERARLSGSSGNWRKGAPEKEMETKALEFVKAGAEVYGTFRPSAVICRRSR
jgi:hypothetical protein